MPTKRNSTPKETIKVVEKPTDTPPSSTETPPEKEAVKEPARGKVSKLPDYHPYVSTIGERPCLKFEDEGQTVTLFTWQARLVVDFQDAIEQFCEGKKLSQDTEAHVLEQDNKTVLILPTADQFGYRLNPFSAFVMKENMEVIRAWLTTKA